MIIPFTLLWLSIMFCFFYILLSCRQFNMSRIIKWNRLEEKHLESWNIGDRLRKKIWRRMLRWLIIINSDKKVDAGRKTTTDKAQLPELQHSSVFADCHSGNSSRNLCVVSMDISAICSTLCIWLRKWRDYGSVSSQVLLVCRQSALFPHRPPSFGLSHLLTWWLPLLHKEVFSAFRVEKDI